MPINHYKVNKVNFAVKYKIFIFNPSIFCSCFHILQFLAILKCQWVVCYANFDKLSLNKTLNKTDTQTYKQSPRDLKPEVTWSMPDEFKEKPHWQVTWSAVWLYVKTSRKFSSKDAVNTRDKIGTSWILFYF